MVIDNLAVELSTSVITVPPYNKVVLLVKNVHSVLKVDKNHVINLY